MNAPAAAPGPAGTGLSRSMTLLFATACGLAVGNLYLAQPLVGLIAASLQIGDDAAGLTVTLAQIGYTVGLLLLVPLGDLVENRRLIALTLACAAAALALAAAAPSASVFFAASLLIGVTTVAVQMLVPFAAHLAPDATRGRVVANVMTGLFVGIVLSRPVSSFIADLFGWRGTFAVATAITGGLVVVLLRALPPRLPSYDQHYGHLLRSMLRLILTQPLLQRRTAYQACLFAAFSLFWTAIPLILAQPPFSYGQRGIAAFALFGAGGALAAPVAGRLADAGYLRSVTVAAIGLVAAAFALAWAGRISVVALGAAAILLDAGVQMNLIVGQRALYGIDPAMRSRINGIHMALFFLGGAVGSALASPVLARWGWPGACLLGLSFPSIALAISALAERSPSRPPRPPSTP